MITEYRASQLEIRVDESDSDDTIGTISGYAATFYDPANEDTEFELWDDFVERIEPGSFDEAIRNDDVRGAFNHDESKILGRTKSNTLRLSVDKVGLRYEIDLPDTSDARDLAVSLRRGDIDGSSFAFRVTDEHTEKADDVWIRWIRGVKLFDVGPVSFPAYKATTAGIRSQWSPEGGEMRKRFPNTIIDPGQLRRRKSLRDQQKAKATLLALDLHR